MRKGWIAVSCILALTACGKAEDTSQSAAPVAGADAQWALDVCKSFPAEAAGKAAGLAVTQATGGVNVSTSGVNVASCTYTAEGGEIFTVGFRHDTSGGTTMAETIAGLTAQPDMTGPVEEIPMAAGPNSQGRAFWTPRLKTLSYLPDDARMVTVTPPGAKVIGAAEPEDKAADAALRKTALAIAEAAAR